MERDDTLFAQQQVVRLQALLEASRRIHATIALDEVLGTVLEIVVREIELTGAFFTHFPQTYGEVPPGFAGSEGVTVGGDGRSGAGCSGCACDGAVDAVSASG